MEIDITNLFRDGSKMLRHAIVARAKAALVDSETFDLANSANNSTRADGRKFEQQYAGSLSDSLYYSIEINHDHSLTCALAPFFSAISLEAICTIMFNHNISKAVIVMFRNKDDMLRMFPTMNE